VTVGEQGPLGAAGLPAVLIQRSGEVGPQPGDAASGPAAQQRLQDYGRGVLRAVNALDTGPDVGPPTRDILLGSRVFPAWGISLLAAALILPVLFAGIDMLARVRRRRAPVTPWLVWVGLIGLPFLLAGVFAVVLGRTGLLAAAPTGPVTPVQLPRGAAADIALIAVALVFGLSWMLRQTLTRRLAPTLPSAADGSDGSPAALVLGLLALVILVWVANPYAALLGVLPLNLWLLATSLEPAPSRGLGIGLIAVSLIPVLGLIVVYCSSLGLGPAAFAWTGLLLVAGGHIGFVSIVLWSLAGGGLVAAVMIVDRRARERHDAEPQVTVRGPVSYAGPGSLGGTDSALRR
jgi:hypothetical protein